MPEWARFIIGGLECPDIDLTLGRDNIMNDVTWAALQQVIDQELEKKIVEALSNPNSALRSKWKSIFKIHEERILRAAVETHKSGKPSFFDAVKDLIPFNIGNERLSLLQIIDVRKYLQKDDVKIIFYHSSGTRDHESSGVQERLIFDEFDMYFIEAPNYYERDFLIHYSENNDKIKLVSVEEGLKHILKFDNISDDARLIIEIYKTIGITARLTKFKPISLSAVILPKDFYTVSFSPKQELDLTTEEGKAEILDLFESKMSGEIKRPYELCINQE